MTTGQQTSGGLGLKVFGVIVLIIAAIGFAASQGAYDSDDSDSEKKKNKPEEPRLVVLTVTWGHFEDTGELWKDTGEPKFAITQDTRDLTITYYIDDVPHAANRDEPPGGPWAEYLAVHPGAEIRLKVEQHGVGGFLACTITGNGKILLPNGYEHRNDADDCNAFGVVE